MSSMEQIDQFKSFGMYRIRLLVVMLLLIPCQLIFAQRKKEPGRDHQLFEQASMLQQMIDEDLDLNDIIKEDSNKVRKDLAIDMRDGILDKSISIYEDLIEQFPQSKLIFRAKNNMAFALLQMEDDQEAASIFREILISKANDKEPGGIGSGIMGEPYANYKHRAAMTLAEIYIKNSKFDSAIYFIQMADKYPYQHFCGNEYAADEIHAKTLLGKCYVGLNQPDTAIKVMLPELLPNGLASNHYLVPVAVQALEMKYGKENLRMHIDEAFKNFTTEDNGDKYFVTIYGNKLELYAMDLYYLQPGETPAIKVDQVYKRMDLYKLLHQ